MGLMEQLSAIAILVDFLFGITIGLVLSVSWASLREDGCYSLLRAAPDPICAGVRVFQRPYVRRGRPVADSARRGGYVGRRPGGRDPDDYGTGARR
jgi:hypothetical protein